MEVMGSLPSLMMISDTSQRRGRAWQCGSESPLSSSVSTAWSDPTSLTISQIVSSPDLQTDRQTSTYIVSSPDLPYSLHENWSGTVQKFLGCAESDSHVTGLVPS